ncbi:TPA: ISLre2 family transposase, partial [Candidatus Poribacteria bacterium]|nr:ISLre2 family transposase [Candidatus Poribacteria bacterium]
FRERTLLTRFGEITIKRRLYKNNNGEYRFLLDDYMNWRPNQSTTPKMLD